VEELPESADPLEWAMVVGGDKLILCYLHDVIAAVEVRCCVQPAPVPCYAVSPRGGEGVVSLLQYSGWNVEGLPASGPHVQVPLVSFLPVVVVAWA
jgi:hypothetical protein